MKKRYFLAAVLVLGACGQLKETDAGTGTAPGATTEAGLSETDRTETGLSETDRPETEEPKADKSETVVRPETAVRSETVVRPETVVRSETTLPNGSTLPAVTLPEITVPEITLPEVTLPEVSLPEITLPEITVRQDERQTVYSLSADILFDFDKADIRPSAAAALQQISTSIKQREFDGPLTIVGHTDSVGEDAYNVELSNRRALSVQQWLISNGGFQPARLSAYGLGESRPVSANTKADGSDDPTGRQQNRRVEIIVRTERQ
ncbi:MAG: OmpA family protein [Cyanobacteria bacterium J06631_9]